MANLGMLEAERGRLPAAEQWLTRAMSILDQDFGPSDTRTLLVRLQLAQVYQAAGRYTAAERIYRTALPLLSDSSLAKDARVQQARGNYERLLAVIHGKSKRG